MINWEKEKLEQLINVENMSYESIGRMYGCCGNSVKKAAKKLGIKLPVRRKVNSSETFNKGTSKKYYCLNCGKELNQGTKNNFKHKYCSNECQWEYQHKVFIEKWKSGEESGTRSNGNVPAHIRQYLLEIHNNSCEKCGWNEIHPKLGYSPLEIHHIDGNAFNNRPENLQLLCPNCHALTENFRALNNNGRIKRKQNIDTE